MTAKQARKFAFALDGLIRCRTTALYVRSALVTENKFKNKRLIEELNKVLDEYGYEPIHT